MTIEPSPFRLKPASVLAMRWSGSQRGLQSIAAWVNAQPEVVPEGHEASGDPTLSWLTGGRAAIPWDQPYNVLLETLTGAVQVNPGDWVILREGGDFWAYSHEDFCREYEAVNE